MDHHSQLATRARCGKTAKKCNLHFPFFSPISLGVKKIISWDLSSNLVFSPKKKKKKLKFSTLNLSGFRPHENLHLLIWILFFAYVEWNCLRFSSIDVKYVFQLFACMLILE